MSVAQTAHSQFEQAYQLVAAINGPLARSEAWDVARELLRDGVNQRHLAEQVQPLRMRLSELEQRLREQQRRNVCWRSSVSDRAKILILTNWKRCIRSWKPASRPCLRACRQPANSVWPCVRSRSSFSRVFNI